MAVRVGLACSGVVWLFWGGFGVFHWHVQSATMKIVCYSLIYLHLYSKADTCKGHFSDS